MGIRIQIDKRTVRCNCYFSVERRYIILRFLLLCFLVELKMTLFDMAVTDGVSSLDWHWQFNMVVDTECKCLSFKEK